MQKTSVMVVEDESIVAKNIQTRLKQLGYIVPATYSSGEDALDNIENIKPNLVLMDIVLAGKMNGLETAEIIHNKYNIPIIYLTAYADDNTLEQAKKSFPYGYLVKPFDITELKSAIEIALNSHSSRQQLIEKSERLERSYDTNNLSVFIVDKEGKITLANTQSQLALGIHQDTLQGQLIEKHIKIPDTLYMKDIITKNNHFHTHLLNQSNYDNNVCVDSTPITNEKGKLIGSLIRVNVVNGDIMDVCIKNIDYNTTIDRSITLAIFAHSAFAIKGIRNIIDKNNDTNVVFEETNLNNVENNLRQYNPEIICIEGNSSSESVLSRISEIINRNKLNTKIILLSNKFDQNLLLHALSHGIKGCLSSDSESIKLKEAIKTVHNGNVWLEAETINEILPKLLVSSKKRKHNLSGHNLTKREEEIARLIIKGYTNKLISNKLFITEKTVKTHLTKIFKKLGINNRLELAVKFNPL